MVSQNVYCKKLIFYLNWNHQNICKECSQTQNTHLLYMKLLPMWYFELQPDNVESTYTPNLPGLLSCFLLILKQQCIGLWLFEHVRCANKWSILYNYRLLISVYSWPWRPRQVLVDRRRSQPIPDAVFMVMSRPKSKVYYCFIKLSGIFLHKDWNIHSYCFLSRPLS